MLTLKKVKEMVKAPVHTKRVPSPKVLLEDGRILLRKEFEHGSHLTLYHSGYVWFSTGKRNTVFHIHDCRGDYAYGASKGKGEVIKEEYFENCEWHIRALFEGEQRVEESQLKCEGVGQTKVSVSYHAVAEDWGEMADSEINVLDKYIEKEALHAIVSPEIARAAHLVASSRKKCGVQDIVVIQQGTLKGFVGIHPNWSGISVESIRSLCLSTYLPEEVMKLNDIAEMRAGATLGKALQSEYMTVSGACFINQSSPVMTISKNGIRFSKACHSRLDDCEYVELLYHPILQVVILRKSNHGFSTTMRWRDDNDVHSAFSARAFSGLVFQTLNWRRNCRYQCRGICRGQGNAKFLIFELDESRILTGKNQYEQENCSMNLKCRLYRSNWVQSITVSDVMESGQVVENPMIGAIPSRNEVQRELDDLLMSM